MRSSDETKHLLPFIFLFIKLKELLSFNFLGLNIVTYDYKNPKLKDIIEHLRLFIER